MHLTVCLSWFSIVKKIWFLFCSFVLVLLLDGRLALGQDGGDLPSHEGPGHVGSWQGAALPTRAEYFIVSSLLLNWVSGARETEFVMTHRGTLIVKILTYIFTYQISFGYLYEMCIFKPLCAEVAFQQGIIWKAVSNIWKLNIYQHVRPKYESKGKEPDAVKIEMFYFETEKLSRYLVVFLY